MPDKSIKPRIDVKRVNGQPTQVTITYGRMRVTFTKDAAGRTKQVWENIDPEAGTPTNRNLPQETRRQVEAILSGKAGRKKNRSAKAVEPPLFDLDRVFKEGLTYHRRVMALARDQQLSPATAENALFLASAEGLAYRPPELEYLHSQEVEHYQAFLACGIKLLRQGVLGFNRTDRTEGKETRSQLKMRDINAAVRQQWHILDGYLGKLHELTGEMQKLEELRGLAHQIHLYVVDWWIIKADVPGREKFIAEIASTGKAIEDFLAKCRNPHKRQAGKQASRLAQPTDSLGRTNPPAKAASAVSLIEALDERMTELQAILPFIVNRGAALEAKKTGMIKALAEAQTMLEDLQTDKLDDHEFSLALGRVFYVLGQVSVLPYRAQADQAVFYLKAARRRRSRAKELLATARRILADRPFDPEPQKPLE